MRARNILESLRRPLFAGHMRKEPHIDRQTNLRDFSVQKKEVVAVGWYAEEDPDSDDIYEDYEDRLEDDSITAEEAGFLRGFTSRKGVT